MTHRIQRKICHIEFNGSEREAVALQARMAELCKHQLPFLLEKVFDRLAAADDHQDYRFPYLEIDLGNIALDQIESNFVERTVQTLENKLKEQITQRRIDSKTLGSNSLESTGPFNHQPWSILSYFLQRGYLPWNFRLPESRNLEQYLQEGLNLGTGPEYSAQILDASESTLALSPSAELCKVLAQMEAARKRLVWSFSVNFTTKLLAVLSPAGYLLWKGAVESIQRSTALSHLNLERILLEHAFAYLQQKGNEAELLAQAIAVQFKANKLNAAAQNAIKKFWLQNRLPQTLLKRSIGREKERFEPPKKSSQDQTLAPQHSLSQNDSQLKPQQALIKAEEALKKSPYQPDSVLTEGVYLENAGLVILYPFLATFFEHIGVAKEDKIIQPERALILLQHLATGQTTAAEYELLLPKLLCNLPLDEPLDLHTTTLSDTEIAEATKLLSAVIQHWTALANSQVDELRGNFLCRFGKLSLKAEGDWLLQIERQSFDILLDQLPWGIGLIKLPWMDKMLWVEW